MIGNLISTLELRRLLYDIQDKRPDICIRLRLLGEMWAQNHMRIVELNEKGAIFMDERIHEFFFVSDLTNVMQFELDTRFMNYQPHFHYDVSPLPESYLK